MALPRSMHARSQLVRADGPVLVRAKLDPPRHRQRLVARPRLTRALAELDSPAARIALIVAPAGFGKSTLVAQWLEAAPRPFSWIVFDSSDNDDVVFWMYLIEALRRLCPAVGQQSLAELRSPTPAIRERVVPLVLREFEAVEQDCVLVLDDVHQITSPTCLESLSHLLVLLPQRVSVVLSTRTAPPLPLPRLRAQGELVEIGLDDLRFSRAESESMLNDQEVLNLGGEDVGLLHNRTEGWPAALYLAALSLRGQSSPATAVASFSASSRHVVDYLTAEVIADLDEPTREFLLQTAILDRITGSLADAITGRSDGEAVLEELWRSNRLVLALDGTRSWYRYHQLLRDLLEVEMARTGAAATAHLRASEWFEREGMLRSAIDHAFRAGALQRAAGLIDAHRIALLEVGIVQTLLEWLDLLPDDVILEFPRLVVFATFCLSATDGGRDAYERWARLIAVAGEHDPIEGLHGDRPPRGLLEAIQSGEMDDSVAAYRAVAETVIREEPPYSQWWGYAQALRTHAIYLGGGTASSLAGVAQEALDSNAGAALPVSEFMPLAVLALQALDDGDIPRGRDLADRAFGRVVESRRTYAATSDIAYIARGRSRAHQGDFAAAESDILFAASLRQSSPARLWYVHALIALVEVRTLAGDAKGAGEAARQAEDLLGRLRDPGRLPALLKAAWTSAGLLHMRPPTLSPAERPVLRLLASSLSLRDIGRELFLSQNTVKSHTRSLYRKLGVATRADAVAAARSRGWL